jgi:hypothetical protein
MTNFNDLYQTRIGTIAEEHVQSFLKDKKWKVYWQAGDYSHPFDGIAYDKQKGYLIEVKAKYPGKYGDLSIHENDLEVYERHQRQENKQMLIFYVDHINKKLLFTTPSKIRSNIKSRWYDKVEKKTCIFFGGCKELEILPDQIANEMMALSNKITNK